jgi:lipoyl(octanoyl) transferase
MDIVVRRLGRRDYGETLQAMQAFSAARTAATLDELWLVEHAPVYTLGLKRHQAAPAPILGIPVVPTDRGGDVTYHGPGQVVAYLLLDLARRALGIKALVNRIEQAVLDLLVAHGVAGERRVGAPGVYVGGAKLAALGLRVRAGRCYHGLALNVDMDLAPFGAIDPCGYPGLAVTQLRDLGVALDPEAAGRALTGELLRTLGYNAAREPHDERYPTRSHCG